MVLANRSIEAPCSSVSDNTSSSITVIAAHTGTTLTIIPTAIVVNLAIVWYENNVPDSRRTLINKLISLMAGYNILLVAIVPTYVWARVTLGPFPPLPCTGVQFANSLGPVPLLHARHGSY